MNLKIAEITMKLVELLEPLESTDRQKIVQASFVLLGETLITSNKQDKPNESNESNFSGEELDESNLKIPLKAKTWMKQNALTIDLLNHVFHISEDNVDVIASEIPGKDTKEKTVNVYILLGISKLLLSGDSSFDDDTARKLCKDSGCYNLKHHSEYLSSGKGNKLTGSKDSGWKLTSPGLTAGADLVKMLTGN